ncbi:MAG: hypothetical protein DRO89_02340, partial [Candidatus Altiarchaeales archaeon]
MKLHEETKPFNREILGISYGKIFILFYPPTYLTPLNWYNSNVFQVDRMSNLSIKERRRIIK